MTMPKFEQLYIIFDGPPGHNTAHFVEVETDTGVSVRAGEWKQQGGYWTLGPFCESDKITEAFEAGKRDAIPEWQPIETAPKSTVNGRDVHGVYILGFCPDHDACDLESCICVVWWEPLMNSGSGMWYGEGGYETHPTHWMPLPAAPKGEE